MMLHRIKRLSAQPELWSVLAMVLRNFGSILLLPIILRTVPTEQMGLWYVLLAVGGFAALADLGLSQTVGRFASSLTQGSGWLCKQGIANATTPGAVEVSLASFTRAARVLHRYVATGTLVTMLVAAFFTFFDRQHQCAHSQETYLAFGLFLIANTYGAYARWRSVILTGLGEVTYVARQTVVGTLVYLLSTSVALYLGGGLVALALGFAIQPFVTNFLLIRRMSTLVLDHDDKNTLTTRQILALIWPNSWRIGLVMLGSFLINSANTLLIGRYLSLELTAQYGLSLQLINVLNIVAYMFIQVRLPQMVKLRVEDNNSGIVGLFGRQIIVGITTFTLGAAVIITLGQNILTLVGSKTKLLSTLPLTFLCFYKILEYHHGAFSILIVSENKVPFVLPTLISGLAIVLLGIWWGQDYGLWGIMAATALVQGAFNNWWPVWKALESVHTNYFSIYRLGFRSLVTSFSK